MVKPVRAKLILNVAYVPGTADPDKVRSLLEAAADHLAHEGLLSGETPAEVESWSAVVQVTGEMVEPGARRSVLQG